MTMMTEDVANLLIRQHIALVERGAAENLLRPEDIYILLKAVVEDDGRIDSHQLWDCGLMAKYGHLVAMPRCGEPHD